MKKWCFLIVLFMGFAAVAIGLHHRGFDAPYYLDSGLHLTAKEELFEQGSLWKVLKAYPTRAFSMATFYFNYRFDGLNPYYVRLVNALILAAVSVAIFLLVSVMLEIPAVRAHLRAREKTAVALAVALMFTVHTVQALVVLYAIQRMALLSCLFYVCGLVSYVATRLGKIRRRSAGYALCVVFFILGLFSKENAITLPVVLLLAEFGFFSTERLGAAANDRMGLGLPRTPIRGRSACRPMAGQLGSTHTRATLPWAGTSPSGKSSRADKELDLSSTGARLSRRLLVMCLAAAVLLGATLVAVEMVFRFESVSGMANLISLGYDAVGISLYQVILSESVVFFRYLTIIGAPFLVHIGLLQPVAVSQSLFDPPVTIAAMAGLIAICVCGALTLRHRPLSGFGMLSLVLVLVPEMVADPKYLCMPYRAVLPTVFFLLLVSDLVIYAIEHARARGRLGTVRVVLVTVFVSWVGMTAAATIAKAELWRDPILLWTDVVRGYPPKNVPHVERWARNIGLDSLGVEFLRRGRPLEALRVCEEALEIRPESPITNNNLGTAKVELGLLEDALGYFRKAMELHPRTPEPYVNLGAALIRLGRFQEAKDELEKIVTVRPRNGKVRVQLGIALSKLGRLSEARDQLGKALEIDPKTGAAHNELGLICRMMNDPEEATRRFSLALTVEPDMWEARQNLADTLFQMGRFDQAVTHYRAVVEKDPDNCEAHNNLGLAYLELKRFPDAVEQLRYAAKIRPDLEEVRANLKEALKASQGVDGSGR